jgi:hypothetical protein
MTENRIDTRIDGTNERAICVGSDLKAREGSRAFIEKRKPVWQGY